MKLARFAFWIALSGTACPAVTVSTAWGNSSSQAGNPLEDLQKKLKDPDPNARRKAVEDLAASKEPNACALVASALADASPLVADEAQIRLGTITDTAVVAVLEGKSGLGAKDPLVRARAAEAIGRLQIELDAAGFAKGLTDHDPDVRRVVARALERLAAGDHIASKSKAAVIQRFDQLFKSDKDLDVRAAAFAARFAVEPLKVDAIVSMRNSKDEGPVDASITQIEADVDLDELIGSTNNSLQYMKFGSVRAITDAIVARPGATSAKSLTALLNRCYSLRLKWRIVDVLQDWSGKAIELDIEKWQEWSDGLSDGWKPGEKGKSHPPAGHDSPAKLLGFPILSDATAFLVDMNGWMSEKSAEGKTNKARFKAELSKMLHAMTEDSAFKIVPYAAKTAECGRDWLLPAKLESVNDALKCFGDCSVTGDDNFDEAFARALRIPGLDTVVVVTDSTPKGAGHVHPDLVLEELTQRNRFHGVFIEVILLHADAAAEEQWRKVCAPSGGRVMQAEL